MAATGRIPRLARQPIFRCLLKAQLLSSMRCFLSLQFIALDLVKLELGDRLG